MHKLYTEKETADLLAVAPATLRQWRVKGMGPGFVKIGSAVRYSQEALDRFVADGSRLSTSDRGKH